MADGVVKLRYSEVDEQLYAGNNCSFSAGLVDGHEVVTIYLRMVRDGEEPLILHFRVDEAMRIVALLGNAVWSGELRRMLERGLSVTQVSQ